MNGRSLCETFVCITLVLVSTRAAGGAAGVCTDGWVTEAPLNMPRALLYGVGVDTAGNIYVVGGRFSWSTAPYATETVEKYDGTSWTFVAPMATRREGHVAVSTGRYIYAIGGDDGTQSVLTVERYDTFTDTWCDSCVPPLSAPRNGAAGAVDALGRIYVLGGHDGTSHLSSVVTYDPTDPGLGWTEIAPLNVARQLFGGAATDHDGRIYAIGGGNSSGHQTVAERYDPANPQDGWVIVTPVPGAASQTDAAVTGADGKIYVVGGWLPGYTNRVLRYDPDTDTWEDWCPMGQARNNMGLALRNNGRIYAIGGDAGGGPATLTAVESLNTCEPVLADAPLEPPVESHALNDKPRYISFVPGNRGIETALQVVLVDSAQFPEYVGATWWVGEPSEYCESGGEITPPCSAVPGVPSDTFWSANLNLGCDVRHCMDWGSLGDVIHVTGESIVPGAVYEVRAIPCACDAGDPGNFSAPLAVGTSVWGDTVTHCGDCPCAPPEGAVNVDDALAILRRFSNAPCAPIKARVDLEPAKPDGQINVSDALACLRGFSGVPYQLSIPTTCQ